MRHEVTHNNEYILKEYEYRLPLWTIVLLMPFSILMTFMGVDQGLRNTQGLIIKRRFSTLVELTTEQATVFYWLMALFGLALLLWTITLAASRYQFQRSIVITTHSIVVPKSLLSAKTVTIPFYEITDLEVMSVNGQRSANLFVNSKKYTIAASCLPKPENFDEILLFVVEAVRQSRDVDYT